MLKVVAEPSAKEFYFVRHGQSEWNKSMIHLGNLDLKLTPLGECQSQKAKLLLRNEGVLHAGHLQIISSPYLRAAQTASIIAENQLGNLIFDNRLKERNFDYKNPEDENEFFARVTSFVEDWVLNDKRPPLIICAHAYVFIAFQEALNVHPSVKIKMGEVAKFTQKADSTWGVKIIDNADYSCNLSSKVQIS